METKCKRCGSKLRNDVYVEPGNPHPKKIRLCTNDICPYSENAQDWVIPHGDTADS